MRLCASQEWKHQLRPAIHPTLFAGAYWLAARLSELPNFDAARRADLLVAVPKIVQAYIAAVGDFYTWKLGQRVYGQGSLATRACVCGYREAMRRTSAAGYAPSTG